MRKRRWPSLLAAIIGALASLYLTWALARLGPGMSDPQWPRPFPYPDAWLLVLHDQIDAMYPVPPPGIKIDGEVATVQVILQVARAISLALLGAGVARVCFRRASSQRGFEVVAGPHHDGAEH